MEETPSAAPKRELALVSHATYVKEKALQYLFFACAFLCRNAAFAFLFFYELSYKYAIMKRCIFLIEVQYD